MPTATMIDLTTAETDGRDASPGEPRGRRRPAPWWVGALGAAALLLAAVFVLESDGDLYAGAEVPGAPRSWLALDQRPHRSAVMSETTVYNAGDAQLRLTGWQPLDHDGVEVVSVHLTGPDAQRGAGLHPDDLAPEPSGEKTKFPGLTELSAMPPLPGLGRRATETQQAGTYILVTTYRLVDGRDEGWIDGIRLTYEVDGIFTRGGSVDVYQGVGFCPTLAAFYNVERPARGCR